MATIGAIGAAAAVIAAIFKKLDNTFELSGALIEREADSPLWNDLDKICDQVGTQPPDRVIAGIDNNFFVTEHAVTLDGQVHEGRTLFVSLSLLKTLQGSQADAVMAHEMAHFSGNDTMYSKKISPLLARYETYLPALHAGGISLPVFYFMRCFRSLFQISLGKLSREREFRADKIASETASPPDIANALLKIAAYGEYRGKVEHDLFDTEKALETLNISQRVSHGFKEFACSFVKGGKVNEAKTAHPFDSHPPFEERVAAVQVKLSNEDMLNVLQAEPDARWYRNIKQALAAKTIENTSPRRTNLVMELGQLQKFCSRRESLAPTNRAPASWTAAALCRFCVASLPMEKRQAPPQSKMHGTPTPLPLRRQLMGLRFSQSFSPTRPCFCAFGAFSWLIHLRLLGSQTAQHFPQAGDSLADVRLARVAKAQAHFMVWFAPRRIGGVAKFARHIQNVLRERSLEHF